MSSRAEDLMVCALCAIVTGVLLAVGILAVSIGGWALVVGIPFCASGVLLLGACLLTIRGVLRGDA